LFGEASATVDGTYQQPSLRGISPSAYLTALLLGEACERGAVACGRQRMGRSVAA
jgi:hypothetical protein